ncbi:MAG TPA: diacylglycerol kinase family protein [Kiritimatiellia bacterium]|nr:diacylglycerol kinase family protein [Kiritimatiellia bacterium]HRU69963.1 diacylglycerol kinase family protein [Kiritimatiellia bacterium]
MKLLFMVAPTVGDEVRAALRSALQELPAGSRAGCEVCAVTPEDSIPDKVREHMHEGIDGVVAVGGDGTVSAVAHALVDTQVPLGIVPAGTGNLVARELGIPLDIHAAVALAAGAHSLRAIDAMLIDGRTYLLNAGVGVNAAVIDRTSRLGKSLFGRTAYVGTAVWKVLQAKPQRLTVTIDGEPRTYDATDVLISNCGTLARVLHPNGPDIRADDGHVDVCIICMKVAIEYPWYYFLRSLFPRHVNRIIHELQARCTVSIRSESPMAVQADGDIIGTTPVTVNLHPKALSVMVPEAR